MKNDLLANISRLHTTALGVERIKKNLGLAGVDVVQWCKDEIKNASSIQRRGKNWYAHVDGAVITVNASSFGIITAHRAKN
ncbi:MAG: DUF3781 domain-containing protein [Defluviitaleaceae bacterium]|nr:DUF3781 domain-containing protein [Defluviitaleaceae bacterium]